MIVCVGLYLEHFWNDFSPLHNTLNHAKSYDCFFSVLHQNINKNVKKRILDTKREINAAFSSKIEFLVLKTIEIDT